MSEDMKYRWGLQGECVPRDVASNMLGVFHA